MDIYTVLGVLVFLGFGVLVVGVIYRIGSILKNLLFTLLQVSSAVQEEPGPRSLNGFEPTLLPLIRRDFPDFDAPLAKNKVRDYLREYFQGRKHLVIHNVVIAQYLSDGLQKTIVFQAALSWQEGGIQQKRFAVHYSFVLPQGQQAVAANCPNCGATLGFGQRECAYCGSRVVNALDQNWQFTQVIED